MQLFTRLIDLVGPSREHGPAAATEMASLTRAERFYFAVAAFMIALVLGALWGVAAGSHERHFALDNIGKVPVLMIASSLVALPVSLLVFRLTTRSGRTSDLVIAHALAAFAGCLSLALLAPLVALYQYSSSYAGLPVAIGSGALGLVVAVFVLLRVLRKLSPAGVGRSYGVPVVLVLLLQGAALAQLASVTSPVFNTRTPMGRGVDALVDHARTTTSAGSVSDGNP